jgi:hypothetical protein
VNWKFWKRGPRKPSPAIEAIKARIREELALFDAFPLGSSHEFLGRRLVVIRHRHHMPSFGGIGCGYYIPGHPMRIEFTYADAHGVIHGIEYGVQELQAVRASMTAPLADGREVIKTENNPQRL